MRNHLRKLRKHAITKSELIADAIFFSISFIASLLIVFLFDVHRSFYEWPIKPDFIFDTPYPYLVFVPLGAVAGFFLIKMLLIGMKEEG